jgi:hypothetical protein
MSSSKQPRSGLSTVKRNFSAFSVDSDPIPGWSPTPSPQPQPQPAPAPVRSKASMDARLKAIQAALDTGAESSRGVLASSSALNQTGPSASSQSSSSSRPSTASTSYGVKRSFDSSLPSGAPQAKKRQLPDSWNNTQASSSSLSSVRSGSSASANKNSSVVKISPATTSGGKTASVFLSKEQTAILKLVEGGECIFYTGSAGTHLSIHLVCI